MYMQTAVCGKREMEGRLVLYKSLRCKRLRPSFHPCFRSTRAGRGEERRRERSVLLERDSEADRRVRLEKIGGGGDSRNFSFIFLFFFFYNNINPAIITRGCRGFYLFDSRCKESLRMRKSVKEEKGAACCCSFRVFRGGVFRFQGEGSGKKNRLTVRFRRFRRVAGDLISHASCEVISLHLICCFRPNAGLALLRSLNRTRAHRLRQPSPARKILCRRRIDIFLPLPPLHDFYYLPFSFLEFYT